MYQDKAADVNYHRRNIINVILEKIHNLRTCYIDDDLIMDVALKIGKAFHLSTSEQENLEKVVRLREFGNSFLSDEELAEAIIINGEDIALMRNKLEVAYRLILATEGLNVIAQDVVAHHENYDGSGLPRGLRGEEIPLKARILKLALGYALLLSGDKSNGPLDKQKALEIIKKGSGTLYDPGLVDLFISVIDK